MSTNTPIVGEKYLALSCIHTVVEVTPAKGVLAHPLMPELHLPLDDFDRMVKRGVLESEPV